MSNLQFVHRVKLQNNLAIVLIRANNEEGKPFYIYLQARKEELIKMQNDYQNKKSSDFSKYGEILFSGWSSEPPAELVQYIKAHYNN